MSSASQQGDHQSGGHGHVKGGLAGLMVGALGVVFGDLGTSPLYTMKEAFIEHYGLSPNHDTVLGILSLVFWTLTLIVTVKYVTIIMRADNDGEGGIMALMALAQRTLKPHSKSAYLVGLLGIFGGSLFFGDGVITPAITTLSAIEGLEVVTPALKQYVLPLTIGILIALFLAQRYGTAKVGKVFGPVMVLWFLSIALVGLFNIVKSPEVLKAINPYWGVRFFVEHGWHGIFILGAVVLCVTGGEALYADMGHFGARPIRYAWYFFAQPCLVLNYLGQGALVLNRPEAVKNPFFEAVPEPFLIPMVVLATAAAIIASQSVISGAFSMARSAMQLGYIPRMQIKHTSDAAIGQIYIPFINWALLLMVVASVIGFGNSTALATAYGVSVTGCMLATTILMIVYARAVARLPAYVFWPICLVFLVIDVAFMFANVVKFMDGAWFPLLLGLVLFTLMRTWRHGRELLRAEMQKEGIQLDTFLDGLMLSPPVRVPGTAIFMTADKGVVPHAFLHNLKHNKVLHARNVFLTVETLTVPYAHEGQRLHVRKVGEDCFKVVVRFGFMETPDVPQALMQLADCSELCIDPMDTTYFASRETILASAHRGMPVWRDKLFALMHRNAAPATSFFRIPTNRLVELGATVQI